MPALMSGRSWVKSDRKRAEGVTGRLLLVDCGQRDGQTQQCILGVAAGAGTIIGVVEGHRRLRILSLTGQSLGQQKLRVIGARRSTVGKHLARCRLCRRIIATARAALPSCKASSGVRGPGGGRPWRRRRMGAGEGA